MSDPVGVRTSVVVPIRNNSSTVADLVDRTVEVLSGTGDSFEILLVDDNSTDDSWATLVGLHDRCDRVRCVRLAGPYGQVPAIAAGVSRSNGDRIVYIDADLEYSPEDMPMLLDALDDGADMVSGVRPDQRGRPLLRRVLSVTLRWTSRSNVRAKIKDPGSGFKAWQRDVWLDVLATPAVCHNFGVLSFMALRAGRIDNPEVSWHPSGQASSYRVTELLATGVEFLATATPTFFSLLVLGGALAGVSGLTAVAVIAAFSLAGHDLLEPLVVAAVVAVIGVSALLAGVIGLVLRSILKASGDVFAISEEVG